MTADTESLKRDLAVLFTLLATACATHTSSIVMQTATTAESTCIAAVDVVDRIAHDFGFRNDIPPGFEPSVLPSGSIVLASYRSYRAPDPTLAGSGHNVYVTVFGRHDCREVRFAITDYESSSETPYVAEIRSTLTARLRKKRPDAQIKITETTTRTLPP